MFSFLRKAPKEEESLCVLTLDGHGATGAVVKVFRREGSVAHPVILFSCEQALSDRVTALDASRKVLERCRSFQGSVDRLVSVMGDPWVMTFSRSFGTGKKQAFKVTRSMLRQLMDDDFKAFEAEILRDFGDGEELGVIDQSQPAVFANGYRVDNAIGQTVQSVDVRRSLSLAPTSVAEMVAGAFLDVFHRDDVSFASLHAAVLALDPGSSRGVFLMDGGATASLVAVDQGSVARVVTVDAGVSTVEDLAARSFGVPRERVGAALRFASDTNLLDHYRDLYYQRIESAYHSFGEEVRKSVLELRKYGLPCEVLTVLAHAPWVRALQPLLERDTALAVDIPSFDAADSRVAYGHEARARSLVLSLAVLRAVRSLEELS